MLCELLKGSPSSSNSCARERRRLASSNDYIYGLSADAISANCTMGQRTGNYIIPIGMVSNYRVGGITINVSQTVNSHNAQTCEARLAQW